MVVVQIDRDTTERAHVLSRDLQRREWANWQTVGVDLIPPDGRLSVLPGKARAEQVHISDAGLVFYLVTGNQQATMTQIKTFFGE